MAFTKFVFQVHYGIHAEFKPGELRFGLNLLLAFLECHIFLFTLSKAFSKLIKNGLGSKTRISKSGSRVETRLSTKVSKYSLIRSGNILAIIFAATKSTRISIQLMHVGRVSSLANLTIIRFLHSLGMNSDSQDFRISKEVMIRFKYFKALKSAKMNHLWYQNDNTGYDPFY